MAKQNGPCTVLYLNRQPKICENREAVRRSSLAPRIRGGGRGPVVLRQTASGVDRAPVGRFSMGKYTAILAPPGPKSVVIMGSEP